METLAALPHAEPGDSAPRTRLLVTALAYSRAAQPAGSSPHTSRVTAPGPDPTLYPSIPQPPLALIALGAPNPRIPVSTHVNPLAIAFSWAPFSHLESPHTRGTEDQELCRLPPGNSRLHHTTRAATVDFAATYAADSVHILQDA